LVGECGLSRRSGCYETKSKSNAKAPARCPRYHLKANAKTKTVTEEDIAKATAQANSRSLNADNRSAVRDDRFRDWERSG